MLCHNIMNVVCVLFPCKESCPHSSFNLNCSDDIIWMIIVSLVDVLFGYGQSLGQ